MSERFTIIAGEVWIDDLCITAPYGDQPGTVGLYWADHEGGDFNAKELLEVLIEFYKERF